MPASAPSVASTHEARTPHVGSQAERPKGASREDPPEPTESVDLRRGFVEPGPAVDAIARPTLRRNRTTVALAYDSRASAALHNAGG
jgi:hypothetical protein